MAKKGVLGHIRAALTESEGPGRSISRLAGGVAHDLNNILLVIQGYAEMAVEEAESVPGLQSLLGEMRAAAARAGALVRDLLVIGERGAFSPRLLDLNEVVRKRQPALEAACPTGVGIRTALAEGLGLVLADEELVGRMLDALCARSRESMPGGGLITITTAADERRGAIILRVTDNGAPLTAEMRERLFEPYLPGPGGGKGQGLGMPVVQAVARRLGAEITVRSLEAGTNIEIKVPVGTVANLAAPPAEIRPTAASVAPGAGVETHGAGTAAILVAEDDDGLRELAVKVLSREGYTVLAARDGQEAVELFQERMRSIGLVVLDDVMPRLGGRAALERIHRLDPGCPLVLCSGYDWKLNECAPAAEGAPRTLLSKPWQPRDLLRKVREALQPGSIQGADDGT